MNDWMTLIIVMVLALIALYFALRKKGLARRISKCTERVERPSGLTVILENKDIILPNLTAVESAMQEVFEKAAQKGYQKNLGLQYYLLVILKADEIRNGQPVLKIEDKAYMESPFKQGGFVWATGAFVKPDKIVIADGNNVDQLKEVVTHEMYHAVLFKNDPKRYQATRVHIAGIPFDL